LSVYRTDRVAIADTRRTAAGVLIVPASVSRTGLQKYRRADGRESVEFRSEAEVFSADSLATLRGAVVTVGHTEDQHPRGAGLASDRDPTRAKRDGEDFVETELLVTDAAVAERVERKDLTEISLGYFADLDPTPGEYKGQRFDAQQKNIRIHHVALLPAGQARAGRQARIRLDGNEELCNEEHTVKIKIGDHVFDEGGAEHIAFLNAETKRERERADALQLSLNAAQTEAQTQKARADGLAAKPEPDVSALVTAELAFRDSLRPLLPADYVFASRDKAKRDAIGAEACARVDAQPEGAARAAYLDGAVAFALTQKKSGTPAYSVSAPAPTADADDDFKKKLKGAYKPGGSK
jgi:hypothetical protein